ncbi:MAG: hypothetical protein LQ350_008189 [Teloschistes chrysophthalmus]|nr:MAG: hypothetical protein LQ350_008189 [Niorma chrysophthalma]
MPDPTSNTVSSKVAISEHSEDGEVKHERHRMAMSYMVTVVHFYAVGTPRFDVLDSRFGQARLAGIRKQAEDDSRRITSRLVVTEDLPRATYDLLHYTLGVDPRLLDDHRRNGHGDGFVGQADLDIDKAPRSSSMSISIPFELQIGPVDFPPHAGKGKNDTVEDEVGGILKHHQLVNYLQRVSFQSIVGSTPTVVLLMYPPLWNLQEFQGRKFQFHTSPDLEVSPIYGAKNRDTFEACGVESPFSQLGQNYPIRTQQVLRRLIEDMGFIGIVGNDLTHWISEWITFNAYGSYEASAESSARGWHYAKSQTNILSGQYLANKVLCEGLRTRITIKLHQMDKAHAELNLDTARIKASDMSTMVSPHDYMAQQWFRSRRTMQWILDDIGHSFRSNESKLQIDLAMTQVEESRKAMQETEVVKRLTALAFIFIPVSTVCSAFGMNVQELSGDLPPIWLFAVVAVAVALVTIICSLEMAGHILWAILSLFYTMMTKWRDWWLDVYRNAFTRPAPFGLGVVSIGTNLAGVKLDSNQRPATKIWTLRGFWLRTLAMAALAPFWIIGNLVSYFRSFERRGKLFKARWPPESVHTKTSRSP